MFQWKVTRMIAKNKLNCFQKNFPADGDLEKFLPVVFPDKFATNSSQSSDVNLNVDFDNEKKDEEKEEKDDKVDEEQKEEFQQENGEVKEEKQVKEDAMETEPGEIQS